MLESNYIAYTATIVVLVMLRLYVRGQFRARVGIHPIKARAPQIVLIGDMAQIITLIGMVALTTYRFASENTSDRDKSGFCQVELLFLIATQGIVTMCYLLRATLYLFLSEMSIELLSTNSREELEQMWWHRHAFLLSEQWLRRMGICVAIFCGFPVTAAFLYEVVEDGTPFEHGCATMYWTASIAPILVVGLVRGAMAIRMRTLRDGWFIKEEMQAEAVVSIVASAWLLYGADIRSMHQVCLIYGVLSWYISVVRPLSRSYFMNSDFDTIIKAPGIGRNGDSAAKSRSSSKIHSNVHPRTHRRQVQLANQFGVRGLRDVLECPDGMALFKQFLIYEWSVENVLFWEDISNFREWALDVLDDTLSEFSNATPYFIVGWEEDPDSDAPKRVVHCECQDTEVLQEWAASLEEVFDATESLRQKYIGDASPFQVNIRYGISEEIERQCKLFGQFVRIIVEAAEYAENVQDDESDDDVYGDVIPSTGEMDMPKIHKETAKHQNGDGCDSDHSQENSGGDGRESEAGSSSLLPRRNVTFRVVSTDATSKRSTATSVLRSPSSLSVVSSKSSKAPGLDFSVLTRLHSSGNIRRNMSLLSRSSGIECDSIGEESGVVSVSGTRTRALLPSRSQKSLLRELSGISSSASERMRSRFDTVSGDDSSDDEAEQQLIYNTTRNQSSSSPEPSQVAAADTKESSSTPLENRLNRRKSVRFSNTNEVNMIDPATTTPAIPNVDHGVATLEENQALDVCDVLELLADCFSDAQQEVYNLMKTDSYTRFLRSNLFSQLVIVLKQQAYANNLGNRQILKGSPNPSEGTSSSETSRVSTFQLANGSADKRKTAESRVSRVSSSVVASGASPRHSATSVTSVTSQSPSEQSISQTSAGQQAPAAVLHSPEFVDVSRAVRRQSITSISNRRRSRSGTGIFLSSTSLVSAGDDVSSCSGSDDGATEQTTTVDSDYTSETIGRAATHSVHQQHQGISISYGNTGMDSSAGDCNMPTCRSASVHCTPSNGHDRTPPSLAARFAGTGKVRRSASRTLRPRPQFHSDSEAPVSAASPSHATTDMMSNTENVRRLNTTQSRGTDWASIRDMADMLTGLSGDNDITPMQTPSFQRQLQPHQIEQMLANDSHDGVQLDAMSCGSTSPSQKSRDSPSRSSSTRLSRATNPSRQSSDCTNKTALSMAQHIASTGKSERLRSGRSNIKTAAQLVRELSFSNLLQPDGVAMSPRATSDSTTPKRISFSDACADAQDAPRSQSDSVHMRTTRTVASGDAASHTAFSGSRPSYSTHSRPSPAPHRPRKLSIRSNCDDSHRPGDVVPHPPSDPLVQLCSPFHPASPPSSSPGPVHILHSDIAATGRHGQHIVSAPAASASNPRHSSDGSSHSSVSQCDPPTEEVVQALRELEAMEMESFCIPQVLEPDSALAGAGPVHDETEMLRLQMYIRRESEIAAAAAAAASAAAASAQSTD
jgi:Regulator of G protein signaling domain